MERRGPKGRKRVGVVREREIGAEKRCSKSKTDTWTGPDFGMGFLCCAPWITSMAAHGHGLELGSSIFSRYVFQTQTVSLIHKIPGFASISLSIVKSYKFKRKLNYELTYKIRQSFSSHLHRRLLCLTFVAKPLIPPKPWVSTETSALTSSSSSTLRVSLFTPASLQFLLRRGLERPRMQSVFLGARFF